MDKDGLEELLRLVSSPTRMRGIDILFGFEVTVVNGFNNETLLVNLNDYDLVDVESEVYRLKNKYSHNKYR